MHLLFFLVNASLSPRMINLLLHHRHQGRDSQNFLICKLWALISCLFLGIKCFLKQISVTVDVIYYTCNKIRTYFLCLNGSKIHVKVTNALRICQKKFCEYPPRVQKIQKRKAIGKKDIDSREKVVNVSIRLRLKHFMDHVQSLAAMMCSLT